MKLSFVRVNDWWQARELMRIRNECREDMTHDQTEISEDRQWNFWCHELMLGHRYEAFLLADGDLAIGYGMLKLDGDRLWMTIGLGKEARGKRLSYVLTNLITAMGHREGNDVWLDCRRGSFVERVYQRSGYTFEYATNGLVVMRHRVHSEVLS